MMKMLDDVDDEIHHPSVATIIILSSGKGEVEDDDEEDDVDDDDDRTDVDHPRWYNIVDPSCKPAHGRRTLVVRHIHFRTSNNDGHIHHPPDPRPQQTWFQPEEIEPPLDARVHTPSAPRIATHTLSTLPHNCDIDFHEVRWNSAFQVRWDNLDGRR